MNRHHRWEETLRAIASLSGYPSAFEAVSVLQPDQPLLCLRPHILANNVKVLKSGLPGRLLYAVKANPHPIVVGALDAAGVNGFDVSSINEIVTVRDISPTALLAFTNPVKSRSAIRTAAREYKVRCFAFDSSDELAKIRAETTGAADMTLLLRIATPPNNAIWPLTERFGAAFDEAVGLLRAARRFASRLGICFHVGSLCLDPAAWRVALRHAALVARAASVPVDIIDLGGGLPVAYVGIDPPPLGAFIDAICDGLDAFPLASDGEVWFEIGRALAAAAGSVLVRVMGRRKSTVYLNDGIYGSLTFITPPPSPYPLPFRRIGSPDAPLSDFVVCGPTCDGQDRLPGTVSLPEDVSEGDFFEVGQHGAYAACLATRFNGMEVIGPVLLEDGPLIETPGYAMNARRKRPNPSASSALRYSK